MTQEGDRTNPFGEGAQPFSPMQNVCQSIIGIVGGMGSYATLHLFRKLLDAFPVEKEWERPRIIVDNNCVMPSRVRAILYGEKQAELVAALTDSIRRLLCYEVDTLVLACNTSHYFLPDIRQRVSLADDILVDLIATARDRCATLALSDVYVVATEGTIATGVYEKYCRPYGITVTYPEAGEQTIVRGFIERVKRSQWDGLVDEFAAYLSRIERRNIVLGCTELSVIGDRLKLPAGTDKRIIDPVEAAVEDIQARVLRKRQGKAGAE